MEDISYHKATLSDLKLMVDLRIQFLMELNGQQPESAIAELSACLEIYYTKVFRADNQLSYYAKLNDKPAGIGAMILREQPGNFNNPTGRVGYLINMYTLPFARRKGICNKLVQILMDDGKRMGIKMFELHATKEGALVYEQNGFKLHEEPAFRKYYS